MPCQRRQIGAEGHRFFVDLGTQETHGGLSPLRGSQISEEESGIPDALFSDYSLYHPSRVVDQVHKIDVN